MLTVNQENGLTRDAELELLIDSLLSILDKEVEIYRELQSLIAEERCVLRRPSLDLLTESNSKKETCILKTRMLEEVRTTVVKKIARHLRREEREINITFLASYTGERQTKALRAQQQKLSPLIRSISELNDGNQDLLNHSLSYVKNSLNFINNLLSTGADYLNSGKLKTGNRNGRILYQEG